jgi:hypothetical protein
MDFHRPIDKSEKHKPPTAPDLDSGFVQISASRSNLLLLGGFMAVFVVGLGITAFWWGNRPQAATTTTEASGGATLPAQIAGTFEAKSGPWGDLECQSTFLEVPEEYLGTRWMSAEPSRWLFKGCSAQQVHAILDEAGLADNEKAALLASNTWEIVAAGIYIKPSPETVLALSSEARGRLYAELGKFEENVFQNAPFHWRADAEATLFAGAQVSARTRQLFDQLCYRRGRSLLFSDWGVLLGALPDETERTAVAKALSRRAALFASLKLNSHTDIESLVKYWGRGGHGKDVRPALEAVAKLPEGGKISIVALLPPTARGQAYTYPLAEGLELLNCHWTSFNFFNSQIDPPASTDFWTRKLKADYQPVSGAPQYGDVLVLIEPNGELIHSCIFLADDIVFTKNGASALAPWQLISIHDLLDFYSWDLPDNAALRIGYYRKNET